MHRFRHTFTLMNCRDIPVVVNRAYKVPQGIMPAFATLESRVGNCEGRRFFGFSYCVEEELEYYASIEIHSQLEASKYELPRMVIPGGLYCRAILKNWGGRMGMMSPVFREMMERFPFDKWRPKVEYYRSKDELQLFLPVKASAGGD